MAHIHPLEQDLTMRSTQTVTVKHLANFGVSNEIDYVMYAIDLHFANCILWEKRVGLQLHEAG